MEEIIEKTKALSWNELSGLLKPNRDRALLISQASLVGRLVSKKIHPLIRTGWRFLSDLKVPLFFLVSGRQGACFSRGTVEL